MVVLTNQVRFLPHQGALASAAIFIVFTNFHKYLQRTAKYSNSLSNNTVFAGSGCFPPPGEGLKWGHMTGISLSFAIDPVEVEAFSFLHQEISWQLILETSRQGQSTLSQSVIDAMIDQFSVLTPVANQCFRIFVIRLAFNVHVSQQQQ